MSKQPQPSDPQDETTRLQAIRADGDLLAEVGMDGAKWAAAFMRQHMGKVLSADPSNPTTGTVDEADMLAWFCNAIMAGFDEATRRGESVLEAATMREQLALSLFRAEKAAKASAEAQLEARDRRSPRSARICS
jgi:hypothetical protein